MLLGIPTFMDFSSVEEHLTFCRDNGYGLFELAFYYPWTQSDQLDLNKLAKLKEKYQTTFSLHLGDIDPFSFSPEIRKAGYDTVLYMLDVASACDAKVLNMHLVTGGYSSICGKKYYIYERYKDVYFDNIKRFTDTFSGEFEKRGCVFCIENTKGFKDFQKDAIELMLEDKNFGLTFDIGHSYKAGGDDEKFILSHIGALRHFHIHDVNPNSNHIALGQGILDIEHYLNLARSLNASTLIEVKSPECLMESSEYLIKHGYLEEKIKSKK